MPVPIASTARLRAELDRIREIVGGLRFGLGDGPGSPPQAVVVSLVSGYLEPRLGQPDAPLLVAVFGPTGSGKSTLVNSLAGRVIGEAGVLRPTTRRPVIWCHHVNTSLYAPLAGVLVVGDDSPTVADVSIVDTPDLDSYLLEHRARTEAMLDRCDAAIFVTTPQRYADAVPWESLGAVARRGMEVLVVANRLSRRSRGAVADLALLLRESGHTGRADDIVMVQEQRLRGDGLLPPTQLKRIHRWLDDLADRRLEVVARTVAGTVSVVAARASAVADTARSEGARGVELLAVLDDAVAQQVGEVAAHLDRGELVKGEVVARWQRLVGVSDLAALIGRGWARARDLVRPAVPAAAAAQVDQEASNELVLLMEHRARLAFRNVQEAWRMHPGAADIALAASFADDELRLRAADEVAEWRADLVELVGQGSRSRFRVARAASIGVNAAATVLLVAVFAQTGGLTGAEVGVVAGAAAAQQTVLEHLFGAAAASQLARGARSRLLDRVVGVVGFGLEPLRQGLNARLVDTSRLPELERAVARSLAELGGGVDG